MANIFIDIDGTMSPAQISKTLELAAGELCVRRAGGFKVSIPTYVLSHIKRFTSAGHKIFILSTWGELAEDFAKIFEFEATNLLISGYTDKIGITGKFEVVKQLAKPGDVWLDDHIKRNMAKELQEAGVLTIKPKANACLSPGNLIKVRDFLEVM